MKLFWLPFLLISSVEAASVDKVAHAGFSYAITHATQAICDRVHEGQYKTECLFLGVAVGTASAIAKEALDHEKKRNSKSESLKDGAASALGITLAVTFIQIDF